MMFVFVFLIDGIMCAVAMCLHGYCQLRGEFVRSVLFYGDAPHADDFFHLFGLALTSDESLLLVADSLNACVVVVDAILIEGRLVRTLQGPADTLQAPCGVAMVPRTGQVLVVDYRRHLVVVFAGVDDDTVVRTLGDGRGSGPRQLNGPQGIAVLDEGDAADRPVAVIADTSNDRLSLFRVDDDTLLRHVGSEGAAPGQFLGASSVSAVSSEVTGSGEAWLVVGDSGNGRVQVLTLQGAVVRVLKPDDGIGSLGDSLFGVTVCVATREVLVTDPKSHRVVSWRLVDGGGCRVVCEFCGGLAGDPGGLFTTRGHGSRADRRTIELGHDEQRGTVGGRHSLLLCEFVSVIGS
jgi:hypothetical protein